MADKLVCPLCGVCTSFSPLLLKGRGFRLEQIHRDEVYYWDVALTATTNMPEMDSPVGDFHYAILACQACGCWFVAKKKAYGGENWSAVYPIPHKPVAPEIPEPIKSEFEEAYLCFAVGAHRGCLLVCRTALIDMQRGQNVSNLVELKDKGIISDQLFKQANQVRRWANVIGHEDVPPEAIEKEDCEQLLTYVEALLDAVYVQPKRLSDLTQKLKQLKEKG